MKKKKKKKARVQSKTKLKTSKDRNKYWKKKKKIPSNTLETFIPTHSNPDSCAHLIIGLTFYK